MEVVIAGGGLVGSLCACFLGLRGISVSVYERREDIRIAEHVQGKSINLALSERGRSALRRVGLEKEVIENHGIPMHARMIHTLEGRKYPLPYGGKGQCIYSVGRRFLNETLITAAEENPNIKMFFNHKVTGCDFNEGRVTVTGPGGKSFTRAADLVVGCDGAYSAVRREMVKRPMFDYSQAYIPHGYLELCIPCTESGEFAMEKNFLHIWPRRSFMLIALPNQDKTYTVTLFMPFEMFAEVDSGQKVLAFFNRFFPDVIPLIGKEKLVKDFLSTKASPLVTVKCQPYHIDNKALILGDAAHAMVPFFGQGMNAGFEDCEILSELFDMYGNNLDYVLPAFTEKRNLDAQVICDLAVMNYIEMRDQVISKSFLLRKKIDNFLHFFFPKAWIPFYRMVTFTKIPYSVCLAKKRKQDKILSSVAWLGAVSIGMFGIAFGVWKIKS